MPILLGVWHQALTKVCLSLPSTAAHGRENAGRGSWVEVKAGRDHPSNIIMAKTGWNQRYQLYLLLTKSEQDDEK